MNLQELAEKYNCDDDLTKDECNLPCFAARYSVLDEMDTEKKITQYVSVASKNSDNDVLVFSVTECDKCWKAWADYAKKYPRKFKVVQGGSGHGDYQCRMYIYTKPANKRRHYKPRK